MALCFQRIDVCDFLPEPNNHPEFFTAALQDLEQAETSDPGKAVAVYRDLLIAMNYIDIVPGCKVPRNFAVRDLIGSAQIPKRLSGKHDAPPKRIVGAVAFIDSDFVRGIGVRHEDGEVHAGWAATNDVNFHFTSSTAN